MNGPKLAAFVALISIAAFAGDSVVAQTSPDTMAYPSPARDDYAAPFLAGISNQGRNKEQPYVTAGDRTYLIGTQDGNFPDMGNHVPGEMGGLWLHPIKLVDGFRAQIADADSSDAEINEDIVLSDSTELINYPYGNRFRYGRVLDNLDADRRSARGQADRPVQLQERHGSRATVALSIFRQDGSAPRMVLEHLDQRRRDAVARQTKPGIFIARDTTTPGSASGALRLRRMRNPLTTRCRYALRPRPHGCVPLHRHGRSGLLPDVVIAGSTTGEADAVKTFDYLIGHHADLLAKKVAHYASIIDRARVRIPDQRLQEVYAWVRVNMEWLVRDVPGIGRGLSGGFMEYPWWFGTETYSLQALTATGDFELAKQTLRLLKNQSMKTNGNGRIVHEITTDGAVSNPGNTQETAQFVLTAGKVFDWTGDLNFAKEMYPAMKMGVNWLLGDMDQNKDLFPEGYGIMEVYGLNAELIDVGVYTQQALEAAAHIAEVLKDTDGKDRYRKLASDLKARINDRFWIEQDGTYGDFYGSRSQAVSAAEGAIKQIGLKGVDKQTPRDKDLIAHYERLESEYSAMPETDRAWITNKNWVIATPMETGIAPPERAIPLLDKIRRENSGEYGPYLSAVERRSMMTISTGVQAVAEGKYGRTEEAMWYVDRIVQTFNRVSPGSISETMPDHGCFTIAWTSYGIVLPLIEHVFGIQPDALNKTIVLDPHLPAGWEDISIEDLPVGTNLVSFSRSKTDQGILYDIEAKQNGWHFVLLAQALPGARYFLNDRPVAFTSSGIRMGGRKNRVLVVSPKTDRDESAKAVIH
jgi:glycogen debranching enzyme